jgi:hypothetical protein
MSGGGRRGPECLAFVSVVAMMPATAQLLILLAAACLAPVAGPFRRGPRVPTKKCQSDDSISCLLEPAGLGGKPGRIGVQGAHLNPLCFFLRTAIPFIWCILSAFLPT